MNAAHEIGRRPTGAWAKRALDLVASGALLTILSPVLAILAALIRRSDGGPALYRAPRAGRGGVPFTMYKFRTMVFDADRIGGPSTANHDPRLTRLGIRMRRWKLDELPQLLNVFKGEMSLVGPRPQVLADVKRYTAAEQGLLAVTPGMTDWASIRYRDEGGILEGLEDPDLGYEQLIRPGKSWLGLEYVRRSSLRVDIEILLKTAAAMLGANPNVPEVPDDAAARLGLEAKVDASFPARSMGTA